MPDPRQQSRLYRRRPRLVLSEEDFSNLEALAEGGLRRNPELANRLFDELGRARVVPARKLPPHVVALGRVVTYRDEAIGQEWTVIPVLPKDADITQQRISVMTPIGVALIGLSEGVIFHWETRTGERRILTVLGVAPEKTAEERKA